MFELTIIAPPAVRPPTPGNIIGGTIQDTWNNPNWRRTTFTAMTGTIGGLWGVVVGGTIGSSFPVIGTGVGAKAGAAWGVYHGLDFGRQFWDRWIDSQKQQFRCPLILDFNRDGNLGLNNAAFFDLTANGFHELTAWLDETNAFLVLDKHGTGLIENGSQMFGHAMVLPNGMTALSGWDALRFFDSNGNGKIDVNDEIFSSLGVLTGDGRFYSLADAGIVSITLPLTASVRGQKNFCLSFCGASRWSEISSAWR